MRARKHQPELVHPLKSWVPERGGGGCRTLAIRVTLFIWVQNAFRPLGLLQGQVDQTPLGSFIGSSARNRLRYIHPTDLPLNTS